MRYASIRELDISNGKQIGISLFVQGCSFHCEGCFNKETWDFDGGEEWNESVEESFLKLADRPFIKRISILGGEPLHPNNIYTVFELCQKIKNTYPDKKIWIYTGFKFEHFWIPTGYWTTSDVDLTRDVGNLLLKYVDVVVDGQYVHGQRDVSLAFRGSSNQRLIDVQKTLQKQEIVLYEE